MGQFKEREQRVLTRLEARLNNNGKWSDATILNVSRRGLMAHCDRPPKRGAFIELRRGHSVIVGQVRWNKDKQFGCCTQQDIELNALMNARRNLNPNGKDRRMAERPAGKLAGSSYVRAEERHARAQQIGRFFEFASIAAVLAIGAFFAVDAIRDVVSDPMDKAHAAMAYSDKQKQ